MLTKRILQGRVGNQAVDILLIAVWFGLVTGLLEGVAFLLVQQLSSSRQVSVEIIWVSALFDLGMFAAIGFVLAIVNRLNPRLANLWLAVLLFTFLAYLDWLAVVLIKWIHYWAVLILAFGLTAAFNRWSRKHEPLMLKLWLRSLPWVVAVTILAFLGIQGGLWLQERIATASLPEPSSNLPNILVVVVDALRADHLSGYGYERPTSPNLDRLAHEGVLFESAFATSSWTLPSHASLLTGRLPSQHGVGWRNPMELVNHREPMLGEALMARGYRTGAFSGNVFWFTQDRGFGRGFVHFEDYFCSFADMLARPLYGRVIESLVLPRLGFEDIPARKRAVDINRAVIRWIDRDRRKPFFVFINYMDVHDPYLPPPPYRGRFSRLKNPGGILNWRVGRNNPKMGPEQLQGEIDAYDGAISYVDDSIGQLVAELQRRESSRGTLIVITSDHGESLGEHGLYLHANSLYRNEIQVPLILSWRGRIPAGARLEQPVTNSALPATVMDLIDADDQARFPGPSLAQFWKAPQSRNWPYPIAEVEQIPWQPKAAPASQGRIKSLVSVPWQYIENEKRAAEVYDWRNDPEALHNLAPQPEMRQEIAQFRRALDQRLRRNPSEIEKASYGDGSNKSGAPSGSAHSLAVSRSTQGRPRQRWVSWFSWLY